MKKKQVLIILIVISILIFLNYKKLEQLINYVTDREKLELFIKSLGVWAPTAFIILYIIVTLAMLSVITMAIVGGIIFGPIMGITYTVIGSTIGLSLAFLIARYLARDNLKNKYGNTPGFKKIDEGVAKDGWFILATTRLLPIFPFGLQNYIYGLTSIGFIQYMVLSVVFMLPGTAIFVMLAGAFVSGDKETIFKYSVTASLIFFSLMILIKIIKKKMETKK